MRRTEALQGVWMIKVRSVRERYEANEFNQIEAAELLGVTEHTFGRWRPRFEKDGEALLDHRLGCASGKRVPVDREHEVEALYLTRYSGFTVQHFHDHLVRDHQFTWGYTWTKAFLQSKGLLVHAKRRGAHRRKRPRGHSPG
jgi:transposase